MPWFRKDLRNGWVGGAGGPAEAGPFDIEPTGDLSDMGTAMAAAPVFAEVFMRYTTLDPWKVQNPMPGAESPASARRQTQDAFSTTFL